MNPASSSNSWQMAPQPIAGHPAAEGDEFGLQVRPMALKVHYTFDRDGQVHCLARWPQTLQIQTIPLDDRTTIGVVDLRTCLQAIAQCSPEIINQHDSDYAVYAHDYSEPDVPLVGQGMLSWGLELNNDAQSQQLLTGRVSRNMLAIFAQGIRETLDVKLKLTAVGRIQRDENTNSLDQSMKSAPTPTETTEWNSFLQSHPTLGHSGNVAPMPSPSLRSVQLNHPSVDNRFPELAFQQQQPHQQPHQQPQNHHQYSQPHQQPPSRPSSIPPRPASNPQMVSAAPRDAPSRDAMQSLAPVPEPMQEKAAKPSRPSSRANRRPKPPTGRPRGRPPKKPRDTGNTSAAEEATDADEAPHKKRAKLIQADSSHVAPFGSTPDSLRVAASISGSLRNMRPIGSGADLPVGSHLQDVPRAPTPVPDGSLLPMQQRRRAPTNPQRRDSIVDAEGSQYQPRYSRLQRQLSISQDARSPTESIGQSPDYCYTPEDSPRDLGSSPPVPGASTFINSSPAPSSPILPPMPRGPVDSGFMSGGLDDAFDEEELQKEVARQLELQRNGQDTLGLPPLPSRKQDRSGSHNQSTAQQPTSDYTFRVVNPGPPELLPATSIYNPTFSRQPAKTATKSRAKGRVGSTSAPVASKPTPPQLTRSNTAPPASVSEAVFMPGEPMANEQPEAKAPHHLSLVFSQPEDTLPSRAHSLDLDVNINLSTAMTPAEEALLLEFSQDNSMPFDETTQDGTGSPPVASTQEVAPERAPEPAAEPAALPHTLTLPVMPPSRPSSRGPAHAPVPASEPGPPPSMLNLPKVPAPFSEAPCPMSDNDLDPLFSKNMVKKQSIKERLESAIEKGEMPPFCVNCGAIETPTWRKVWTQDHDGVPPFYELSDKAGCVTTVDILERDAEDKPTKYRLVKKNLGPMDPKADWRESPLCNPCGIWLTKFKSHRPPKQWDKDASRLNQSRRKRDNKGATSRSKKAKTKGEPAMNPTSEAYFATDPWGPMDLKSPDDDTHDSTQSRRHSMAPPEDMQKQSYRGDSGGIDGNPMAPLKGQGPGSTHSRGSGTADSPIAVEEDDLGGTRRLLFPSPRKDGVPKILGELAVNVVQTSPIFHEPKMTATGKENESQLCGRPTTPAHDDDGLHGLFGTPLERPSTPPLKDFPGPFKTPTRPTPSHRPITRSISRSIRSVRVFPKSPSQALIQRTPTRTPRSRESNPLSASKRRTPARHQHAHAHFALNEDMPSAHGHFDSPLTATLNQLLSEANDFTAGSPSHGLVELDLSDLPNLGSDGMSHHLGSHRALDFGNYLSTDLVMPSSPPLFKGTGRGLDLGASLGSSVDLWAHFDGQTLGEPPSEQ